MADEDDDKKTGNGDGGAADGQGGDGKPKEPTVAHVLAEMKAMQSRFDSKHSDLVKQFGKLKERVPAPKDEGKGGEAKDGSQNYRIPTNGNCRGEML